MVIGKSSYNIHGVQLYSGDAFGFLIDPGDLVNILDKPGKIKELVDWCITYGPEESAIHVIARCGNDLRNLSDSIIESLAYGELASQAIRDRALTEVDDRKEQAFREEASARSNCCH